MQCVLMILGKGSSSLTWSRSAFSPWGTATTRTVLGLERNKECQEGREKLPALMTGDLQRNATNWRQPAVRVFGENLPQPGVIRPHLRLQLSQKKHLQKMSIFWTTCKRGRWGICKKCQYFEQQSQKGLKKTKFLNVSSPKRGIWKFLKNLLPRSPLLGTPCQRQWRGKGKGNWRKKRMRWGADCSPVSEGG